MGDGGNRGKEDLEGWRGRKRKKREEKKKKQKKKKPSVEGLKHTGGKHIRGGEMDGEKGWGQQNDLNFISRKSE